MKAQLVDIPVLTSGFQKQSTRTVAKEQFDYLGLVSSLLHIASCVRCDVSYVVGVLARYAATPGPAHVRAANRILMYLYRARALGITYQRNGVSKHNFSVVFDRGNHPVENDRNLL